MGFRGKVTRSTLAEANESRDWRIFADFAQALITVARPLYADDPTNLTNSNLTRTPPFCPNSVLTTLPQWLGSNLNKCDLTPDEYARF